MCDYKYRGYGYIKEIFQKWVWHLGGKYLHGHNSVIFESRRFKCCVVVDIVEVTDKLRGEIQIKTVKVLGMKLLTN